MDEKGRPTKYKKEFANQAGKLCELGATDQDLADFFEVDRATIHRWRVKHETFCNTIKIGKESADNRVERSLYERANGYSHEDVHISNYRGDITITPIIKHYPPDTGAGIFWLKNRRPEKWRDKQEIDNTHSVKPTDLLQAFNEVAESLEQTSPDTE